MPLQQITSADIVSLPSGSVSNTQFATGAVENYMSAQGSSFGMRNRLINGDMRIDQRNAGGSASNPNGYTVDRWYDQNSFSASTGQQVTDAPSNFGFSYKKAITTGQSLGTSAYSNFQQAIEIQNLYDLQYGTASAAPITVSFWVKSSITGAHSFAMQNYTSPRRSYLTSYTINNSNTWEYKTITVPGDTSYGWGTGGPTAAGLQVRFSQGAGSQYSNSTSGSWISADNFFLTGCVTPATTTGATWYVTGVQLEKGSTASAFEYRDYGRELQMCQRYYEKSYDYATVPGTLTGAGNTDMTAGTSGSGNIIYRQMFAVSKRTAPTMTAYNSDTGASGSWVYINNSGGSGSTSVTFDQTATSATRVYGNSGNNYSIGRQYGHWVAVAEL